MRPKPHISTVKDTEITQDRNGVDPRKSVEPAAADHWDFLEEIEAPVWVDLTLEASPSYKDNDDDWFQRSHPFHQCSSRHLRSVFPRGGEGNANVGVGMQELSSPKLPPSVSRSRGKLYRSKKWEQINCEVTSNKHEPDRNLSIKSSWASLGSGQNTKTKPSNGYRKVNAGSMPSSFCKSSLTETAGLHHPKPASIVANSKTSSSCVAIKEAENKSESTVTSENRENKYQKLVEVSSQTVGHTSGLLSALKITLRKSCVTRQASRVERDGGRKSEGCKSSSGNSSVGSSSNPGFVVKNTTLPSSEMKDTTPDSRSVMRAPPATKDKVKVSIMPKESTARSSDLTSNHRGGYKTVAAAKSVHLEPAKSKGLHSQALRQHQANKQDCANTAAKTDGKAGVNKYNILRDGKENAMCQRSKTRPGGMVPVQKVTKQIAPQKSDNSGLIAPKRNISGRRQEKSLANVTQKVYFR